MRFSATFEGQQVIADVSHETGRVELRSPVLPGAYTSPEKIEAALKAWDLAQRKDFANKEAFVVDRAYNKNASPLSVTVTSVSADGKEAWVKQNGERRKIYLSELYANREQVEEALKIERQSKQATQDAWEAVERWRPQAASRD